MRLGTLRYRVPGGIRAVAFAPDGKTIAVSGGDLFLIDAASGKRLRQFPSQVSYWDPETLLAFSPDGKRLAIENEYDECDRAAVRVWELDGERRMHEYDIGQWIIWVGWSVKNEPLAIRVGERGVLHLHDLTAGRSRRFECKEPLKYPNGNLRDDPAVACSPAGKVLAVVDNKNVIHVWDTATGRERCTLQPKGDVMRSLTLSPDGSRLVSITWEAVQMWDVATAKTLYTVDMNAPKYPSSAAFTSDSKTLAILDSGRTIRFCDAETGRERGRTEGEGNFAPHFAFSPDGKWLVTTENNSRSIDLWDVATGRRKPERRVGHRSWPHGTAFMPDGRRMATGGGTDDTIYIWDLESGESLTRIRRPNILLLRNIAFSPDGRSLFSTWDDDNLWISGAVSGERLHVLKLEDLDRPDTYQRPISMYPSDDGKTLIVLSYYYSRKNNGGLQYQETLITGWDTSTHKELFRRRRRGTETRTALSADARVLAVPHPEAKYNPNPSCGGEGPMRLEDVRTGELLLTFPALEGSTWPLAFSPDGRLLASNNFNGKRANWGGQSKTINEVRLWETATAAEVLSLPSAHQHGVAFTRDNRLMAVAAPRQEIVVWDLLRGCEWRRFKGFDAEVADLAFSPDGRRLISGLADSTWLIWNVGPLTTAAGKLGTERLAKAWADLAGDDAPRAFRARGALALSPEETVLFLKEHLHPAQPADAERLRHLLAELESEQFAVREKAQKTLEELGDLAEPALRQTLTNKPMLEVRRRVQALLEHLRGPVTKPETLRTLRAVAVLEDIGTPPARRLLEILAQGAPESRLTREAKASFQRLHRRMASAN
jgi:WD40 repeat protein